MIYRVIITEEAEKALDDHIQYIAVEKQEPINAENWLEKALDGVNSLSIFPHRCPIAPESRVTKSTIRMLIIDRCTFLYSVDEEKQVVRVTRFLHGGIPRPE